MVRGGIGGGIKLEYNGIPVDIYSAGRSSSFVVNSVKYKDYLLACPKPLSRTEYYQWDNTAVRIPARYHDMLSATYGEDYMVPKKELFRNRMKAALETGRCLVMRQSKEKQAEKLRDAKSASGILVFLSDRSSFLQALALAGSMSEWETSEEPVPPLEIYHNGTLSYYLQQELEVFPFVSVLDISSLQATDMAAKASRTGNDISEAHLVALSITRLKYALVVSPSIIFLQNPLYLVQTMEFAHDSGGCSRSSKSSCTCVTSTDYTLTYSLQRLPAKTLELYSVCSARAPVAYSQPSVVSKTYQKQIASIHESTYSVGLWAYPSFTDLFFAKHLVDLTDDTFEVDRGDNTVTPLFEEYHTRFISVWQSYIKASRLLLLDKKIEWAAFDAGLSYGTMNSLSSAKYSRRLGSTILTIDLASTVDGKLVGIHNDESFFPDEFRGAEPPKKISQMDSAAVQLVRHPCLPYQARTALQGTQGRAYDEIRCRKDKIASAEDFLDELADVDLIVDLKGTTEAHQIDQAKMLLEMVKGRKESPRSGKTGTVSVRFFSSYDGNLVASIAPEIALNWLATDDSLPNLPFYINVPSALACSQITSWILGNSSFLNKNIAGCFVVMNHEGMESDWQRFQQTHNVVVGEYEPLPETVKMICDVPRRGMDAASLRDGFRLCVAEGFDIIHHPFHIPLGSGIDLPAMLQEVPNLDNLAIAALQGRLSSHMIADKVWKGYRSHWGYTSPMEWSTRQQLHYIGDKVQPVDVSSRQRVAIFRCVSKLFVVMLLLRLEELGLIDLDMKLAEMDETTLREILTNAQSTGALEKGFQYNNTRWGIIPHVVSHATGMQFLDAMQYYVLEPMGVTGSFDTKTSFPPMAARGFVGTLEDLLLVGSTLASGGVSPKTNRQILQAENVERMLQDSASAYSEAFQQDTVTQSMKRFYSQPHIPKDGFPHHVVDGYAMGLWRVNGWRTGHRNVRGWLSMGSSETLLYFDTSGLVVAMLADKQIRGYELTSVFAGLIRDLGGVIDASFSAIPKQ